MIELYYGDGKGKTTAATGAAIRAAGYGIPVLFVQFLKDGTSGEVNILKGIEGISVIVPDNNYGFANEMNEDQCNDTKHQYDGMLNKAGQLLDSVCRNREADTDIKALVVLDEVLHAVYYDLLNEEVLLKFIDSISADIEVILTGWNPSETIKSKADYITRFTNEKHPFNKGVIARKGVEL